MKNMILVFCVFSIFHTFIFLLKHKTPKYGSLLRVWRDPVFLDSPPPHKYTIANSVPEQT